MAVFTTVSQAALQRWIAAFDLGPLLAFEGIASGIENSNFFIDTQRGRFVLTLFERLQAQDLPFYLGLMQHLARGGIACPDPVANRDGQVLSELCGKPAALVTRLEGRPLDGPSAMHCARIGELLARMHLAAIDYSVQMDNTRGLSWWRVNAPRIAPHLDEATAALLNDELAAQQAFATSDLNHALRSSAVHADLFRDNVLFDHDQVGGVIDFYFAATDRWLFDLAITCNDWCIDEASGAFDLSRLDSLLRAYAAVRPFDDTERRAWPIMLRAAAFRFWMSRLYDFHLPRPAEMVTPKNPLHFERILRDRRHGVPELP
jgi:homoserine kinase type II